LLEWVDVGSRSLEDYAGLVEPAVMAELERVAEPLRGARVLHVNATPYGGGVSELLRSVVPLLNGLGLLADWKVIHGDAAFFEVTKTLHNALQGSERGLSDAQKAIYWEQSKVNAALAQEEYDFVFVHDPQPVALPHLHGKGDARWIWRCHIDTRSPNEDAWRFLRPFLDDFDAAVFTMPEFVPLALPIPRVEVIPPAIDPLNPKNVELPEALARRLLSWIGIRVDRPLVTQVARFDAWKDPMGVIAAYRLARQEVPGLRLALVGSMALDDPEGWDVYRRIRAELASDRLARVYTNLTGVGDVYVNAFQRLSSVIVQKSIREGFGLVVSEALWKGTPVVAGRAGGIPLQMADGVGGVLVDDVDACAAAIVSLLRDPERARQLGASGKRRVQEQFLMPRLVLNELQLMTELAARMPIARTADWYRKRDPVCGMALPRETNIRGEFAGVEYRFCSENCKARFYEEPERYAAPQRSSFAGR
jgi:trehalose synthase